MRIMGNGRMITRDASNAFYENGAVAMDGNTMIYGGKYNRKSKEYISGCGIYRCARWNCTCRHLLMYMNIFTVHLRGD